MLYAASQTQDFDTWWRILQSRPQKATCSGLNTLLTTADYDTFMKENPSVAVNLLLDDTLRGDRIICLFPVNSSAEAVFSEAKALLLSKIPHEVVKFDPKAAEKSLEHNEKWESDKKDLSRRLLQSVSASDRCFLIKNQVGDVRVVNIDQPDWDLQVSRFAHPPQEILSVERFNQVLDSLKVRDLLIYAYLPDKFENKHPEGVIESLDVKTLHKKFRELNYGSANSRAQFVVVRDPKLAKELGISPHSRC